MSKAVFTALLYDSTRVIFQSSLPLDEVIASWVHGRTCDLGEHVMRLTREDGSVLYIAPMGILGFDTKVVRPS